MPLHVVIELDSMGPEDTLEGNTDKVLLLEGEHAMDILPVFTSMSRFWDFVNEWYEDDTVRPSTFPMTPFRLAELLEKLGVRDQPVALVFDPIVDAGEWRSSHEPMVSASYHYFISAVRPYLGKLTQEERVKLRHLAKTEAHNESTKWWSILLDEVYGVATARVAEWEVGDDS